MTTQQYNIVYTTMTALILIVGMLFIYSVSMHRYKETVKAVNSLKQLADEDLNEFNQSLRESYAELDQSLKANN